MAERRLLRRLLGAALLALAVYAGIAALLFFRQHDLVYFPAATRVAAASCPVSQAIVPASFFSRLL